MLGTVPSTSQELPHLILTTTLWDRYYYHLHFTVEENEAQKLGN